MSSFLQLVSDATDRLITLTRKASKSKFFPVVVSIYAALISVVITSTFYTKTFEQRNQQKYIDYKFDRIEENLSEIELRSTRINKDLQEAVKALDDLITSKKNAVIKNPDEESRRLFFEELQQLLSIRDKLKTDIRGPTPEKLENHGSYHLPAKLKSQASILSMFGTAYAAAPDQATLKTSVEGTAAQTDNTISRFRAYISYSIVAFIISLLIVLGLICALYVFLGKIDIDQKIAKHQEENRRFAKEMLKGLVGFFTGLVTGMLVGH